MNKIEKLKLLTYGLLTMVSYLILITQEKTGIGIPIFMILQFIALHQIMKKKKVLLMFIPIFLISLSFFISSSTVFHTSNLIVIVILYSFMSLLFADKIRINSSLAGFIKNILENVFEPLNNVEKPFTWIKDRPKSKSQIFKRVIKGLFLSIPFLILVLVLLANADMVFSESITPFLESIVKAINFNAFTRIIYSFIVGLYLMGMFYPILFPKEEEICEKHIRTKKEKDTLVANIVLGMILIVYTVFVVIQFRYLFAKGSLPYDLSYAQYARRGFFELLFLTGFNIILILVNIYFNKHKSDLLAKINKGLLYYLCTVTVILLISSFYRMYLYSSDFGLTRLRFYVFGFLIFEFFGLLVTYYYIYKPKFNILFVYFCVTLTYYVLLNIIPADRLIAKNQVDRYLANQKINIDYIFTLSLDAASEIERLAYDSKYFEDAERYFKDHLWERSFAWQNYNIAVSKANQIKEKLYRKTN